MCDYVYMHAGIYVSKKKVSEPWKLEFQNVLFTWWRFLELYLGLMQQQWSAPNYWDSSAVPMMCLEVSGFNFK